MVNKKKPKKKPDKPTKERSKNYESKLAIVGSLDEVLRVSIPKKEQK